MAKVYWLTGLSGAGKTTIGKELYARIKSKDPATLFLDGDILREVFGNVFGYSADERRKCAMCYSRLCRMVSEQGVTVICCTVSMFDSVRDWNRENIPGYVEVYIRAATETLRRRDQKGLYSGVESGKTEQVMGMDIEIEEPKNPDIIIENNGDISIDECVHIILKGDQ